jgi:hypothetical protein
VTQSTNPSLSEQKAALSEGAPKRALDWATAEDAYHLVQALLAQVTAANDLIVLLATRALSKRPNGRSTRLADGRWKPSRQTLNALLLPCSSWL